MLRSVDLFMFLTSCCSLPYCLLVGAHRIGTSVTTYICIGPCTCLAVSGSIVKRSLLNH